MASILSSLSEQSILILGLAREGISTYHFLRHHFPDKPLTLADERSLEVLDSDFVAQITTDRHLQILSGEKSHQSLDDFTLIFKSPGIPPSLPEIQQALKHGTKLSSNTQLFFDLLEEMEKKPTTIGVTGTKGKSTTTALIHHVLKENKLEAILIGNIGTPPLSEIEKITPQTIVVAELSSHQLADLTHSPHIAVVQEITSEHLDYYPNTEAYVTAKTAITRHQKPEDIVIYNEQYPTTLEVAHLSPGKHLTHSAFISEHNSTPLWENCPALPGKHNQNNILPACIIGNLLQLTDQQIKAALSSFKSLPHRLQLVARIDGIRYYNDSLSTTPEATIAAINAFENTPLILLAGGFERHQNFSELARTILHRNQETSSPVKTLILFPTTGERIWEAIQDQLHHNPLENEAAPEILMPRHIAVEAMEEAVEAAQNAAEPGDIVLLSPASASFNLFKDYADRGEQFEKVISQSNGEKES